MAIMYISYLSNPLFLDVYVVSSFQYCKKAHRLLLDPGNIADIQNIYFWREHASGENS